MYFETNPRNWISFQVVLEEVVGTAVTDTYSVVDTADVEVVEIDVMDIGDCIRVVLDY